MQGRPVLIVEDDPTTSDVVRAYLERDGFGVVVVRDGERALEAARTAAPCLMVLDVMIPGLDGFEVAQRLRARGDLTPILMLSARADEVDRILGLRLGADDYLVKPFSPRELVARVHALLRRSQVAERPSQRISAGDVSVSVDRYEATVSGRDLELTRYELLLLATLLEQPGRVWTRAQLLARASGDDAPAALERSVDVHVARIRQKLAGAGAATRITTVRGVGYKTVADVVTAEASR